MWDDAYLRRENFKMQLFNTWQNEEKYSEFTKTFGAFRILKQLRRISGSEHAICPNISAKQKRIIQYRTFSYDQWILKIHINFKIYRKFTYCIFSHCRIILKPMTRVLKIYQLANRSIWLQSELLFSTFFCIFASVKKYIICIFI